MATLSTTQPHLVSLEEWEALEEDDSSELVRGHLEEAEVPNVLHEATLAWLIHILRTWAIANGARVFPSGVKFVTGELSGRLPDASVYLRDAKRPPVKGLVRVAPSIAIEVVSATARDQRRDRIVKLAEYAAFGIRWYWLVDPELRTFEIFELDDTRTYRHVVGATEGTIDPVPGCSGLVIDVAALFRELDDVIAEGESS